MKLNKILLGCLLFACIANSGELKLESTTGGNYLTVKDGDYFTTGYNPEIAVVNNNIIMNDYSICEFSITAKEKIEILNLEVNKNIPKEVANCTSDARQIYEKSPNQGVLKAGETRWYKIKCLNLEMKAGLKSITITTDKNKATYKNPKKYVDEDYFIRN